MSARPVSYATSELHHHPGHDLSLPLVSLSTFYYWYVFQNQIQWYHHHTYLLAFAAVVLSLAPCGRSYSLDRWLALRRSAKSGLPPPTEEGNLFGLRLLALQMAVLYFFAFWDKFFIPGTNNLFWNFLNGSRLEQIALFYYFGSSFQLNLYTGIAASLAAITVCLLELLLPLLLVERFQKWLIIPGITMHATFYMMLPVATYSLTCILLYLAIIDANKIHAFIHMLGPKGITRGTPGETLATT